jgi:ATP-binding cassette subfamily B protein
MTPSADTASTGQPAPDELPPSMRSLWRTTKLGYRAEPKGLSVSFLLVIFTALPDALIALWLAILVHGYDHHDRTAIVVAAIGLAFSAALTWFLKVVFDRVQRRFRDRVSIALESHVAELQATVATVEHHERIDYVDRLSVLRDQVFALDHLFMSLFSTVGWIVRLVLVIGLLMSVHPSLILLVVFALPTVYSASWRPGVERETEERVASSNRLARHLFVLGTTAPPGKEIRVARTASQLPDRRASAWDTWYRDVAAARWGSALWHTLAWAVFGAAYVGAIVFVASGLNGSAAQVTLVLVAGSRLSQYVGATVGEIGFLRGIWLDSSRRLTWLEDYAAAVDAGADASAPARLDRGIHLEHVSFRYPGTDRLVLDDVTLDLPAGAVIAIVGENGAGKTTLVKLLSRMYAPTSGRIEADGIDIARIPSAEWRDRLAGAFQDFFRFEFSAQQTVGLGEVERLDERPAAEAAVERAGAGDVIERLAFGYDTQLGPTWDAGVEVSFGQWQKLALARGFMRDEPLLLMLDEPTAALDAETEHALFERFAGAAQSTSTNGRITILVSHRFSTVRMADLIVVLDGAHVVEVGTHDELMAHDRHYADLYNIQAAAYQ